LSVDDTVQDLKRLVSLTGFSRIPVYGANKSNIVGIVNIYDILFDMEGAGKDSGLREYVRDPVYVGREDPLDITLTRLRNRMQPMGIVAGEDKVAAGIVTIEDMLEEIVGEIEDTGWKV
jgi:CBS domain containing-hemolysin-like protein